MQGESNVLSITSWLMTSGFKIVLIILFMFVALKLVKMTSRKMFIAVRKRYSNVEYQKRVETFSSIVSYILSFLVFLIAAMIILREIGIDIAPLLASAGVVGLAVGFGAQSLVKDVISGFFILLEDQIRVGDVVSVAGKSGVVEKINLKLTTLRDLAGNVHYIPNGQIDIVTNMTKDYSRYVFDIGVAYREDVDEVIGVIKQVDEKLRQDPDYKDDILEAIEVLGLDQFGDSAIIIKARTTTKPVKQWRVAREFNRRLKKAFDEKNIEIPFPHTTLYMGKDKQDQSPPLNVVVEKQS
ncbi:mechanosensitive ion channel family protein [bacterium]|nr:mechanosensitive ion channel family protein [bacterium]